MPRVFDDLCFSIHHFCRPPKVLPPCEYQNNRRNCKKENVQPQEIYFIVTSVKLWEFIAATLSIPIS